MTDKPFKVHIVEPDVSTQRMYEERGHTIMSSLTMADIVHWTSGPDLHPSLYNDEVLKGTNFHRDRDRRDINAYNRSYGKQLRVGHGRGAQFLNVMNGGAMFQKVEGHTSPHYIYDTVFSDRHTSMDTDQVFVSSTHHQMMIPTKDAEILGFAVGVSHNHQTGKAVKYAHYDPEVVWYEKTKALCFQPHPEVMNMKSCTDYFFDLLNYIIRGG